MIAMQRTKPWLPALLALAALSTGCSSSAPAPTDKSEAAALVVHVLEAWKGGSPPTDPSLADAVNEPRWTAGWKLEKYELKDTTPDGAQARCKATLWLKDAADKPLQEAAEYTVTVKPKRTVMRMAEGW